MIGCSWQPISHPKDRTFPASSPSTSSPRTSSRLVSSLPIRYQFHYSPGPAPPTLRWPTCRKTIVTSSQSILWTPFSIMYESHFEKQNRATSPVRAWEYDSGRYQHHEASRNTHVRMFVRATVAKALWRSHARR